MTMPLAVVLALAARCAPTVAPETLLSVVQVESRFEPLAVGVNGARRLTIGSSSADEAIAKAGALIAAGRNIDLGLAQINSRNLGWLGLSLEQAFDPCRNLAAAASVLQAGYNAETASTVGEQAALRTALSRYNTGDPVRGFNNGYVGKVTSAAARIVPAIQPALASSPAAVTAEAAPSPPSWDVFGQMGRGVSFVIHVAKPSGGASN
jgi:type IV secretion system protein VirB1